MPKQIRKLKLPENDADDDLLWADPFTALTEWSSPENDAAFQYLAEDLQPAVTARKEA